MKTKYLNKEDGQRLGISRFPNFHKSGSITGMKKLYYGMNALLVRCGGYIYNVSSEPAILLCSTLNHTTIKTYRYDRRNS